ncbi:MAG: hypothetical protein V1809_03925 [Planctomycetota bacterium]
MLTEKDLFGSDPLLKADFSMYEKQAESTEPSSSHVPESDAPFGCVTRLLIGTVKGIGRFLATGKTAFHTGKTLEQRTFIRLFTEPSPNYVDVKQVPDVATMESVEDVPTRVIRKSNRSTPVSSDEFNPIPGRTNKQGVICQICGRKQDGHKH